GCAVVPAIADEQAVLDAAGGADGRDAYGGIADERASCHQRAAGVDAALSVGVVVPALDREPVDADRVAGQKLVRVIGEDGARVVGVVGEVRPVVAGEVAAQDGRVSGDVAGEEGRFGSGEAAVHGDIPVDREVRVSISGDLSRAAIGLVGALGNPDV